jgi:hypothetical protein
MEKYIGWRQQLGCNVAIKVLPEAFADGRDKPFRGIAVRAASGAVLISVSPLRRV